jgi:phosphoglycerate dehydrogenase-like enzyme
VSNARCGPAPPTGRSRPAAAEPALTVACAVAPGPPAPAVAEAVAAGGGRLVDPAEAEVLVWTDPFGPDALRELLADAPGIRWVQLPFAGVERFDGLFGDGRAWTSTKGAYSEPVAEHALALGLAGLRQLPARARAREWGGPAGHLLTGGRVTIVGGGGITSALLRLLEPFRVDATVVRRHVADVPGARRVVGTDRLHDALAGADLVVLALALTAETAGIVGGAELERMPGHAWLVNVARGPHVVTDDLVDALRAGTIGGAALDVTDPEPLPAGHPLWDLDNCLITPHVANTWEMAEPLFAGRIRDNLRRRAAGQPLLGLVDPALGY